MKKLLALALFLMIAVSVIGCAKTKTNEDSSTSKTSSDQETTSTESKSEFFHLSVTSWRSEDLEAWNRINSKFTEKYPNITVSFEPVKATEYDAVLLTSLKSGNAADIIFLRAWGAGRQIYDAGYVIELTEEDIPNLKQLPQATKVVWQNDNGVSYGVPGSVCYGGFFYNKGIFKECSVSEPSTWAEFMNACRTIASKGYTPIAFGIKDSWMVAEYLSATIVPATTGGSGWHAKLMNKEVNYMDAGFIKHFDYIKEISQYFPDGFEGIGYTEMQQLFLSEAAAIYPVGTFELGYLQSMNPDIDLGFFFMPNDDPNEKFHVNFGAIMGYAINSQLKSDTAKLEAAKTYINWLADVEASQMFGNEVLGQYAVNPAATTLENLVSKEIISKLSNADLFQQMPYQKLSDQSPDYTTAISEAVYALLVEGCSSEEAAQKMMESQSWYFN